MLTNVVEHDHHRILIHALLRNPIDARYYVWQFIMRVQDANEIASLIERIPIQSSEWDYSELSIVDTLTDCPTLHYHQL